MGRPDVPPEQHGECQVARKAHDEGHDRSLTSVPPLLVHPRERRVLRHRRLPPLEGRHVTPHRSSLTHGSSGRGRPGLMTRTANQPARAPCGTRRWSAPVPPRATGTEESPAFRGLWPRRFASTRSPSADPEAHRSQAAIGLPMRSRMVRATSRMDTSSPPPMLKTSPSIPGTVAARTNPSTRSST